MEKLTKQKVLKKIKMPLIVSALITFAFFLLVLIGNEQIFELLTMMNERLLIIIGFIVTSLILFTIIFSLLLPTWVFNDS